MLHAHVQTNNIRRRVVKIFFLFFVLWKQQQRIHSLFSYLCFVAWQFVLCLLLSETDSLTDGGGHSTTVAVSGDCHNNISVIITCRNTFTWWDPQVSGNLSAGQGSYLESTSEGSRQWSLETGQPSSGGSGSGSRAACGHQSHVISLSTQSVSVYTAPSGREVSLSIHH